MTFSTSFRFFSGISVAGARSSHRMSSFNWFSLPCSLCIIAYDAVYLWVCRSAILLDVVAVSALIIYVFRVVLGYKQTWDRYQVSLNI